MTAVVIVSSFSPMLLSIGLAVTIAVAVLVAHWGAYRPQVKRMVMVSLILLLVTTAVQADGELVIISICARLEPWSVLWILEGCWLP